MCGLASRDSACLLGAEIGLFVWYGDLAAILQTQHKKNNKINQVGQKSNIQRI